MAGSAMFEPVLSEADSRLVQDDLNRLYGSQMRNLRKLKELLIRTDGSRYRFALRFYDDTVVPASIEDFPHHIEIVANGYEKIQAQLVYQPGRVNVLKADLPKGLLD
jgi:hypothetical protein